MTARPSSESLSLPEGRAIETLEAVARRARSQRGPTHVVGAEGSGPALIARALAVSGVERVVLVSADIDDARRAAADVAFVARGLPFAGSHGRRIGDGQAPLAFLPSESSPWADVRADRRAQMTRVAALFHLARGLPWSFFVTTAAALVRKVPPAEPLLQVAVQLVAEAEIDV